MQTSQYLDDMAAKKFLAWQSTSGKIQSCSSGVRRKLGSRADAARRRMVMQKFLGQEIVFIVFND